MPVVPVICKDNRNGTIALSHQKTYNGELSDDKKTIEVVNDVGVKRAYMLECFRLAPEYSEA